MEHGKARDIDALSIRDRQPQKCICDNIMTAAYARSLVYECGASLEGKGMDFQLRLLRRQLADHYRRHGLEGGIFQFDLKSYFRSIPHEKAKERVKKHIADPDLQEILCGYIDDFKRMKQFDKTDPVARGVGLGSQTSQNIALDYVSPIDHYVKDRCGVRGYGRYMDDGYAISGSLEELKRVQRGVFALAQALDVPVNVKKCRITPFKGHGFRFLKMHVRLMPGGRVVMRLGKTTKRAVRRKLRLFRVWVDEGKMQAEDAIQAYQSWRAHARRCNSWLTLESMDEYFVCLFRRELAARRRVFPCTLRGTKTADGWVYTAHGSGKAAAGKTARGGKDSTMEYVVHHRLKGEAICGRVNLPYGTPLEGREDGFVYGPRGRLCAAGSDQGQRHLARNDDGHGLERGAITYAAAFAARGADGARYTGPEREKMREKYAGFLREDCPEYLVFNNAFFGADIAALRAFAADFGLKTKAY